ncbi:hypothetical protein FQA39_LY15540 [Lamprigera yunnana]|nr:hypothetical protein FQA39_LY15540 [Lamprigera yunnana]
MSVKQVVRNLKVPRTTLKNYINNLKLDNYVKPKELVNFGMLNPYLLRRKQQKEAAIVARKEKRNTKGKLQASSSREEDEDEVEYVSTDDDDDDDSCEEGAESPILSPQKARLSYKATLDREKAQCINCDKYEGEANEQIYRVSSANCVHARLNTTSNAEDVKAWDIHYRASCYTKLKTEARAATKSSRSTFHQQIYDLLIIAQLLALVKCNNSPQKVTQMRKWYENRLETEKSYWVCPQVHFTGFNEHLLKKLGLDWYLFNDGKEVIFPKTICADLADTARTQVSEDEAYQIVDVAVLLKKYILFQQMPFNGSFTSGCLNQSHEHSIQFLKTDSGPKDLYGQNEEKEVVEISKPEVLRVIDDFERNLNHLSVNNQEHQESADKIS